MSAPSSIQPGEPAPPAKHSSAAAAVCIALSVLALMFWLLSVATLTDLAGSDAAGNAYAQAYAAIELIILWALLAIIAVVAAINGSMRWIGGIAALILIPMSGLVSGEALEMLSHPLYPPYRWPIVIPALAPLLIIAFCLWSLLPSLRARLSAPLATGLAWGMMLILCASIVPLQQIRSAAYQKEADVQAQYDTALAKLAPDAPLWEWTPFLNTRNESLAGDLRGKMSKLPRRQAETELMLERGDFPLGALGALDLDPTPSLCDKARALLRQRAAALVLQQPQSKPFYVIGREVDEAVSAMNWLVGYECSCDAESRAWEATANSYKDPGFDLVRLRELRDPNNLGGIVRVHPARFSMLTPRAHLKAWLSFAEDTTLRERALDGARKLDHRTSDAVDMLHDKYDISAPWIALRYLPVLDLEPNEALCGAALYEIRGEMAKIYRPTADNPLPYRELLARLGNDAAQLPALQWLASHGCDAEAALTEAESLIGTYQESAARSAMLGALAQLHRKP